jgi:multidrug efflux pump
MCAVMIKHAGLKQTGVFGWFNRGFDKFTVLFGDAVVFMIKRMVVAFAVLAVLIWGLVYLFRTTPTSFVPNEDQGYLFGQLIMPDAAALPRTVETSAKIDKLFTKNPAVDQCTVINGYSLIDGQYKPNVATFFVTLKDFKERYSSKERAKSESAEAVIHYIASESKAIETGLMIPIAPPAILGIGTTGGFEFWIQDKSAGNPLRLDEVTRQFIAKARARPELTGMSTTFRAAAQQMHADVDRSKAVLLGLPISDVYSALQAQFGSIQISQFNQYSRVWNVVLQSDAPFRAQPNDITRLYTRSVRDKMIPLSTVVSTNYSSGPDIVPHFNGFPAAQVTGGAAPGFSSGTAIATMEAVAREVLPQGFDFAWSGMAYQEKASGSTSVAAFAFGLVIVFLVLAAQFESWTLPGSVMTAVPFGILGALAFNWMRGLENDVYFQIGMLVLIGLGAKNAVLRVTFAVELRHQGLSIMDATIKAGEERLRPIIMTSLAFILGVLPLAIATGAGANARHSIGTGIMGGMIGEATLAMLYVPLFFYLFDRLAERNAEKAGRAAPHAPATDGGAAKAKDTPKPAEPEKPAEPPNGGGAPPGGH